MSIFGSVAKLDGPGTFAIEVVGESHYQAALETICGGRTFDGVDCAVECTLVHEDDNPYDNQAIRVDIQGMTVGYLDRSNARQFRARLREAGYPGITATFWARIRGGWDRGADDRGYFGVRLDLPTGSGPGQREASRAREFERKQAEAKAAKERERARLEVESFEDQLNNLVAVHKTCRTTIDWHQLATATEPPMPAKPTKPEPTHCYEDLATKALARYVPTLMDRLLFRASRRRKELEQAVETAKEKDRKTYSTRCAKLSVEWKSHVAETKRQLADWQTVKNLAARIATRDIKSFAEAIKQMNGFAEVRRLGARLKFSFAPTAAEIVAPARTRSRSARIKVADQDRKSISQGVGCRKTYGGLSKPRL